MPGEGVEGPCRPVTIMAVLAKSRSPVVAAATVTVSAQIEMAGGHKEICLKGMNSKEVILNIGQNRSNRYQYLCIYIYIYTRYTHMRTYTQKLKAAGLWSMYLQACKRFSDHVNRMNQVARAYHSAGVMRSVSALGSAGTNAALEPARTSAS
jgi:hypothetical protein